MKNKINAKFLYLFFLLIIVGSDFFFPLLLPWSCKLALLIIMTFPSGLFCGAFFVMFFSRSVIAQYAIILHSTPDASSAMIYQSILIIAGYIQWFVLLPRFLIWLREEPLVPHIKKVWTAEEIFSTTMDERYKLMSKSEKIGYWICVFVVSCIMLLMPVFSDLMKR